VPHAGEGEGLHLPSIPEALNCATTLPFRNSLRLTNLKLVERPHKAPNEGKPHKPKPMRIQNKETTNE
jgi:hypothetical protein